MEPSEGLGKEFLKSWLCAGTFFGAVLRKNLDGFNEL